MTVAKDNRRLNIFKVQGITADKEHQSFYKNYYMPSNKKVAISVMGNDYDHDGRINEEELSAEAVVINWEENALKKQAYFTYNHETFDLTTYCPTEDSIPPKIIHNGLKQYVEKVKKFSLPCNKSPNEKPAANGSASPIEIKLASYRL